MQRGFLDGLEGLTIAHMAALYNFLKYAEAKNMSPRGRVMIDPEKLFGEDSRLIVALLAALFGLLIRRLP